MDNKLQVFNYNDNQVRVMEVDGKLWFVAKDVCDVLGLADVTSALRTLDDDEKLIRKISGAGQSRDMATISESGLYALVLRSNKPEAKNFARWVRKDVLTSISKHGVYMTPAKAEEFIANPDLIIRLAEEVKAERARAAELEMQKTALAAKIEQDKSKVIFAEAVDASKDSILIGNFAKLLCQNGINVGQNRLFSWFREHGYLISCRGERWNFPKQEYVDKGYFEIKKSVVNNPDGSTRVNHTPKITGKGQIYFLNKFLDGSFQI